METKVQARIDVTLKEKVKNVLDVLGISESQAIRMLYAQIALQKALPFNSKIPNAATLEAINEAEKGITTKHNSSDELFSSW